MGPTLQERVTSETWSAGLPSEAGIVRRSAGSDGERVSYLVAEGARVMSGQTILLIHGSGVSARSWTEQLWGLGQALRALAIDLPGHGESDPIPEATVEIYADSARGLLDALGTGPVFVAGHSLGGGVAQVLAGRYPEAVTGLVLVSTCTKLVESDDSLSRVLRYLPEPIRKLLFFWMAKKIGIFFWMAKKMLFAPGAPRQAIRLGMEEIRTCRPDIILWDVAAAKAMNLEDVARGLRVPTLILCGSQDRLTPPALSRRLNELITGSRLHILEGAGHMLPLEAPQWVNQKIMDFIESVAPGEAPRLALIGDGRRRSLLRRLFDKIKARWKRSAAGGQPSGGSQGPGVRDRFSPDPQPPTPSPRRWS